MAYSRKRIRVRDIWIDWHPGYIETDLPGNNTRILPAVPDLETDDDANQPIYVPQPVPPSNPHPTGCVSGPPILSPNLLRGVPASQWIRIVLNGGIVLPVARFTNGRSDIIGWNILNRTNPRDDQNNAIRPLIYTLPIVRDINSFKFHYSAAVALNAGAWIPSIIAQYPIQMGDITIRLFDANNKHLNDVRHSPKPDVIFAQDEPTGPFDWCTETSLIEMKFNKLVKAVKFIHIHFHGRHVGLCEIEAFPNAGPGPVPPSRELTYFPELRTLVPPTLPSTPFAGAAFSHINPFTSDVEPGTIVFGNNFSPWVDGDINTRTGHSGSLPMANVWVTLNSEVTVNGFRFYKYDDPAPGEVNRRLDVKPSEIFFYNTAQELTGQYTSPIYTDPVYNAGDYYIVTLRLSDNGILAENVKYIKFGMLSDGFLRNINHFDMY